nr:ribonuclease H-like domain-containing protein [Tanacetum cinerariifolium]
QNAKLIDLCGEKGIKRDYSNARTPQQNGVTERKNKTLIEAARSIDHLGKFEGKANEGFLVGYAANSTQDTNINPCTQDDDSESECDEQAILVPSFPSNSFSAEKYGFEFSNETAEMLHQAKIETRRNLVLAAGDPTGSIVSTGGVPAGSVPAGDISTSSVPASSVPAGSVPAIGVLTGSVDSAGFGDPAASESVPVIFNPDHVDNSTFPPGHSLGSSEYSTRFPSSSDLGNHQPKAGIFSSSSYDDDFCADVTNLASMWKKLLRILIGLLPCKRRCNNSSISKYEN